MLRSTARSSARTSEGPRWLLTLAAAGILALTATGCGADDASSEATGAASPSATVAETTAPAEAPSESPTATPAPSTTPPPTTPAPVEPVSETARVTVWVEDDWTVREASENLCAGQSGPAVNSDTGELFSCGPEGARLDNCYRADLSSTAVCIEDWTKKTAVSFPVGSDTEINTFPSETAQPLGLELADGTMCTPADLAGAATFEGRAAGYECADGSLIVDNLQLAEYGSDTPSYWQWSDSGVATVLRAHGAEEPQPIEVKAVHWAALPGSEPFYWS